MGDVLYFEEFEMTDKQAEQLEKNTLFTTKIHTLLVGYNGGTGLVQDVDIIKKNMVFKVDCVQIRKNCKESWDQGEDTKRRSWKVLERILMIIIAVTSLAFGSGILIRSAKNSVQNIEAIRKTEHTINQNDEAIQKAEQAMKQNEEIKLLILNLEKAIKSKR